MEFLDLPDDVLLLVFSNLYGEYALNVALTSKRLSALALPRVAAMIECNSRQHLRRLHAYLLSGTHIRAQYVRTLAIEVYTFKRDGVPDPPDIAPEIWQIHDDTFYDDVSQAHLIGDILLHSFNICELALERFQPCLQRDPRIGIALSSMTNLRHLRLSVLGDAALSVLQSSQSDITRLTLSYHTQEDLPLPDEPKTMPVLLDALAHFRNLRILKLWNFNPDLDLSAHYHTSGYTPPELPSVVYLRMSESSVPALDMVRLCPSLRTLIFSVHIDFDMPFPSVPIEPFTAQNPSWRPLRRLMLSEHFEVGYVLKRLGRVDLLQIGGDLMNQDEVTRFLDLLRVTSPIELYLSVIPSTLPSNFWPDFVRATPRLRVLELKVDVPQMANTHVELLNALPGILAQLPVPCLRLYFPMPQLMLRRDETRVGAQRPTAQEQEIRRIEALRSLPQRLINTMPSLRYLAVLDGGRHESLLQGWVDVDDSDSEDKGRARTVYEWDELRHTDHIRSTKWWRVVDGPEGRTMQRITEQEGERMQQAFVDDEREASEDALTGTP
ncbi:hypothetical protein ONZ51_g8580 [Trametes cubensis]|uniref:F-box domain-containing protein n=1 Tax=Trametes cubensis TaxID=1111947 RepID=A0AAD7TQI8_9APHY|nr:hypothetical protein ONZ51_g8580 [Trametes cubensis]